MPAEDGRYVNIATEIATMKETIIERIERERRELQEFCENWRL